MLHDEAILELWEYLYHQGNVGVASYSAVPALVQALSKALKCKPTEEEHLLGYYAIHASINGQLPLARALFLLDVKEILGEYGEET
ncbi:hypothetical protein MNBD_GAMMA12-3947 [hydrothermal vent metagenome]|uniref:Uncharacterized protein n=1 Tax=hydrothermal vent metagenome TaxID=652676 RepID=A0A3B0YX30_9ZZZZ